MSVPDADVNPYELLDLKLECTEQEIRTANDPDAARKFHVLTQSYELLLDPLRRLALDAKLRVKQARDERFKSYDAKRKNMVTELEERERVFKKARMDQQKEDAERWHETEKIKDEGRRLREERENALRRREAEAQEAKEEEEAEAPTLDPLDTTIRLKYALPAHPNLTTPAALSALLAPFGATDTDSVVLKISTKAPKAKKSPDKPWKNATALVPFKQIGDAFAAVCASGRADRGLDGIEIGWVGGKEPEILAWLKKMGKLSAQPLSPPPPPPRAPEPQPATTADSSSSPFASFPASFPDLPSLSAEPKVTPLGVDYEALTLMRLRQAERERLEREILEQEAAEGVRDL